MTDYTPVLIKDARISNISDQIQYGVYSGAGQNTYQQFQATSTSSSAMNFNVTIPSENTIVDRNILINATYKFAITVGNVVAGETAFSLGTNDAFQAFPINSSITSMNASINNTNVSINTQDVLPQLLRMIDPRDLQKYSGMTPTLPDLAYNSYSSGTAGGNNPLAGFTSSGSSDNYLLPRGSHPLKSFTVVHNKKGGGGTNSTVSTDLADTWVITMSAEFTEPLFLSPFLFGGRSDYNSQGFVGLSTLNLNLNIDSSLKRFWSTNSLAGRTWSIAFDAVAPITNAKLLLNFLSSQPTDLIKARNVIPYIDYPRYITGAANSTTIGTGATGTVVSQNIQLNQIPDSFIICGRKAMSAQTPRDTATFYPIKSVSINFNNASGLLSSATQQDLWRISKINGTNQSWYEFSGYAGVATDNTPLFTECRVATTGSLLVLNPARDLSLPPFLSNGSIGSYNFQINVMFENNTAGDITPELVIITANSGVFTTISGSSNIYTGVLTKQIVLDTNSSQDGVSSAVYNRMVGGSLSDMVSTGIKYLPVMKKALEIATSGGAYSGGVGKVGRKLDQFV